MFKNIFSFRGRIRRTEYWLTGPLIWIILIPITLFAAVAQVLLIFIWIIPFWITLAAAVKRSQDLGNYGWLILIPIYNPFFLAFGESQPFENKYGLNPKGINNKVNDNANNFKTQNILKINEMQEETNTTKNQNENPNIVINNKVNDNPNNFNTQNSQKFNEKQKDTKTTKIKIKI